jgi:hypothetical protein
VSATLALLLLFVLAAPHQPHVLITMLALLSAAKTHVQHYLFNSHCTTGAGWSVRWWWHISQLVSKVSNY